MADERDSEKWDAAEEGAELMREGDLEAAVRALEAVVLADPHNEYGFFFLGGAHFEAGRFDKAMAAYVRALEIAPGYVGAMTSLAHSLRMLGRHDEAIRVARQVLARAPEDGEALHVLGLSHYARGDRAAALGYLERFLATRPEIEVAQELHGLIQVLRGEAKPDPELN